MLARSRPPWSSNGVTAIMKTPELRSLSIRTSRSLHPLRSGPRGRPPVSAITAGYRKIDASGGATLSSSLIVSRCGGADECREDAEVALADRIFWMPLDAEAEAAARILDALDDPIRCGGVYDH